jgi:hypothetical protein
LWGLVFVLSGNMLLDALEVSVVIVALPSIGRDLGLGPTGAQWMMSGFALGFGGLLLSGLFTQLDWRWAILFPAPVALILFAFGIRLIPGDEPAGHARRRYDFAGAICFAGAMVLLVYAIVSPGPFPSITRAEIVDAFTDGWSVEQISAAVYAVTTGEVPAWLVTVRRNETQ